MLVAAELAAATNPAAKWNMRLSRIKAPNMSKNILLRGMAAESISGDTLAAKIIFELCKPRLWLTLRMVLFALLLKLEQWYFLLLNY